MQITYRGRLGTGDDDLDLDYRDATILTIGATSYLYASTGANGGLVAWELGTGGSLPALEDALAYLPWAASHSEGMLLPWQGPDGLALVYGHDTDGALLGYRIGGNGDILGHIVLSGFDGLGHDLTAIAWIDLPGGARMAYLVDSQGQLRRYTLDTSGAATQRFDDTLGGEIGRVSDMAAITIGGVSYLLTAEADVHMIGLYQIDPATGALTMTAQLGAPQGVGIDTPTAFETVTAFGKTWAVVAGAGSGSLTVMEITAGGGLRATDHILDTLETRFDGVVALSVVETGGQVFVLAAGADDGLVVFSLLPTGALILRAQIVHDLGDGLANVETLAAHVAGDVLHIYAGGGDGQGLSFLTVDLGPLGGVQHNTDPGTQTLEGTEAADILIARGRDTLLGGAGDDLLVAQGDGAVMRGGAGADTFVLDLGETRGTILDFERGLDRIDFSLIPGLRDPSQLRIVPIAVGARIFFQGEVLVDIRTADGTPLTATDILGLELTFDTPDRALILATGLRFVGTGASEQMRGSADGDVLIGRGGADLLEGMAGDDRLEGGTGADTLKGGAGDDRLEGGEGADLLEGGDGIDRIWGGAGDDRLEGMDGDDDLSGGLGDDVLLGGAGHDKLEGNEGHDRLQGGIGNDILQGQAGDDLLIGGGGNDKVLGGDGTDRLFGKSGRDVLEGGNGDDTLNGGRGHDRLIGGDGGDRLLGASGNDRLAGGRGNDVLQGHRGNDSLWGGVGADKLWGAQNNDRLFGQHGPDRLSGGSGDDTLKGGSGRDRLFGGSGDDRLLGGGVNDTLKGGGNNDTLNGGRGADVLVGGTGADVFVFDKKHGRDRITDFDPGHDRIDLKSLKTTFDDLKFREKGGELWILTGQGKIILHDIDKDDLDQGDFLF